MNDFEYLLSLPGEDRERHWLQQRLETLSVREGIVLAAAVQRTQPEDMEQAINCLQSLDDYDVRLNAGSYEALGQSFLLNDTAMPMDAIPFADLTAAGRRYEDWRPGLFVGDCYVQYHRYDYLRLQLCYLEVTQWQTEVTPELFENLVEKITIISVDEARFQLLNGLELTERLV